MLTVPEAARRVGRDPETVRRWIRAGRLSAWKVGTQHVIDEADLALVVGPDSLIPPAHRERGGLSDPELVAAVHRSRAGRTDRIEEAAAPYQPDAQLSARQHASPGDWLPAIVGRIVREVDPARIILFGSRATGQARADSDYDLLVVLDQVDDRRGAQLRIRAAIDDLPISKDVLVATSEEVDGRRGRPRGVLHWALAEGRLLYQRV